MAQQTAVEWLVEQLQAPCRGIPSDILEQAKAMEKEQIVNAIDSQYNYANWIKELPTLGEQYYKETYKNQTDDTSRTPG